MNNKLEARIARLERLLNNSNRKPTLEHRIARLENAVKSKKTRKFESFESDLDEAGARAKADRMAKEFASVTGMAKFAPDDLDDNVIVSPIYGWLTVDQTDDIADDPDARFAFQYSNSKFTIIVFPTDGTVVLLNNDSDEPINPKNGRVLTGYNDDIEDPFVGAFPMSVWANAKLKGVKSAKEITPEDKRLAEFISKAYNYEPTEIAKLVNKGYDIDMQDKLGRTALMYAIMQGNHKVVEYLLEAGADPNIADKRGWTALKIANTHQKTHPHDIIGTLLEYGAHE